MTQSLAVILIAAILWVFLFMTTKTIWALIHATINFTEMLQTNDILDKILEEKNLSKTEKRIANTQTVAVLVCFTISSVLAYAFIIHAWPK